MGPKYRLTYFNVKALAEPIRMLFYYAGVEFEDVRIEHADWPKYKPNMPWNVLPVLEEDGKQLSQSTTILRYLGRKFKLAGADEFQTAKCNEYVDAVNDVRAECMVYFKTEEEAKKAELKTKIQGETLPRILQKIEDILKKNGTGVLVGNEITYADFYVAHFLHFLCEYLEVKDKLEASQGVAAFCTKVFNLPGVKEWIARRPVTQW